MSSALRVEIRPNEDGTIDEVVLYHGKEAIMHIEQLDTDIWWMGVYPSIDECFEFNFYRKGKRITLERQ